MNLTTVKRMMAGCAAVLLVQCMTVIPKTYALETSTPAMYVSTDDDDPEKFKAIRSQLMVTKAGETSGTSAETDLTETLDESAETEQDIETTEPVLVHNSRFDTDYVLLDGIDVSKYQGVIDWEMVAADGIDFAIIRIGYRGYGEAGNMKIDDCFETNLAGAKAAGIDVGVYFFTQAITEEEAVEEANFVLENLHGAQLDLPIYIDAEDITYATGRMDSAMLSVEAQTANCAAFCETIMDAGYEAGVYANKNWLNNRLDSAVLEEKYDIWLANYTTQTSYTGEYQIWQYTSNGTVSGITGAVDRNVQYSRNLAFLQESVTIALNLPTTPAFVGDGKLNFTSSDESVAVVDENGCITPLKNGTVNITATSDNGSEDILTVNVTAFSNFLLNYEMLHFSAIGETKQLMISEAENTVYWMSENDEIVTVSGDGHVVASGYGTTNILAMDMFGNRTMCKVMVTDGNIKPGDCNGDGVINATDAAAVLIFSASYGVNSSSMTNIPESIIKIYDANVDGTVNALDASVILMLSAAAGAVK